VYPVRVQEVAVVSTLRNRWFEWGLVLVTLVGLGIDAYVHLHIASSYRLVRTSALSQTDLFRIESALAIAAGVGLVLRPGRLSAAVAFIVAAGGVAAVTFYYYVDPGQLGPIPDMYEPVWYSDKSTSLDGEIVAAIASLLLLAVYGRRSARHSR
jgi:hypothetical protein